MRQDLEIFFDENKAKTGHGKKSLRGGAASMASRGVSVFVQVASTMILARLLDPSDVGLNTLVASFTGLAPVLIDLGTRDAAVQKSKINREEVSALFWLTLGDRKSVV